MSTASSLHNVPTLHLSPEKIKAEHNISLVDHTKPPREAERSPSTSTAAPSTAEPPTPLLKRLTNNSLSLQESVKQQLAKQKYAKYGQDRYTESTISSPTKAGTDDAADTLTRTSTGVLERGRQKAKGLLKRKRTRRMGEGQADTAIDILYENQRGWFLFGVPRFSASTLLPSDPRPWQNAQFRTSPVSILSAQVPDPNWEWVWKSWYVDMSRDVDEEGWEYSLLFRQETNWHGNHPWFHSFVRRRRWVRMRRRKTQKGKGRELGHELSEEYFTIHPATLKPSSDEVRSRSRAVGIQSPRSEDVPIAKMEVSSIGDLALALRKAAVDREKLVAVRKFVNSAGDELFYLAAHMEDIMGRFVYQSSRRQLLSELISHHEEAHEQQNALAEHEHKGDSEKMEQHGDAVKRADNLHRAVRAAEDQVGRLEYWSDIKHMPHMNGAGANGQDDDAFRSKQAPSEGAPELHKHPEHTDDPVSPTNGKATGGDVSKRSSRSVFFDAPGSPPSAPPPAPSVAQQQRKASSLASRLGKSPGDESDGSTGYITAGESVHDDRAALSPAQQGREKAVKLGGLDGLMDEEREHSLSPSEDEEEADAEADAHELYRANGDEEAADPEPPSALSGRGAGGMDEVVVSGEDAKAAENEGQGLRLMAKEPEIGEDVDIVEEGT